MSDIFKGHGIAKMHSRVIPVLVEIAQNGIRTALRCYVDKASKESMISTAKIVATHKIINHYVLNDTGRIDITKPFVSVIRLNGEVIDINNTRVINLTIRK